MADPVGRRHVLAGFLVLAQVIRVVSARTEEDPYFVTAAIQPRCKAELSKP